MRLLFHTIKTACFILLVLVSTPLYSEQSLPDVKQRIQALLHDIDNFDAQQFDPCRTEEVKKKGTCRVEELILWSGYNSPPTSKDFKANQYSLNSTPAGIHVEKTLNNIRKDIKPEKLDWVTEEKPIWIRVSAAYVKHLIKHQPKVSVYIGKGGREQSVFCKTELPLLLNASSKIKVEIETHVIPEHDGEYITAANQWPCGTASGSQEEPEIETASGSGEESDAKAKSGSGKKTEAALKLAQKALEALPGFSIAGKNLSLVHKDGAFSTTIKKLESTLTLFQDRSSGSKNWHAQLVFNNPNKFSFQTVGKKLANDILGNISPSKLMLVISSADETVSLSNMTPSAKKILTEFAGKEADIELFRGVNIFSLAKIGDKGLIGGVKKVFQVGNQPIKLGGQINKDALETILQKAGIVKKKSGSGKSIKTKLIVALPSITPLPYSLINDKNLIHMEYPSTKFTIERDKGVKEEKYEVTVEQDVALWIKGKSLKIKNTVDIVKSGKSYDLKVNGKLKLKNKNLFGLEGFNFETISLSGTVSQNASKNSTKGLDISVDVTLPNKIMLVGSFDLKAKGKKVSELLLSLKARNAGKGLTLASLPVLNQFPKAKNVSLDNFAVGINPQNKDVYIQAVTNFTEKGIIADATILHKSAKGNKGAVIMFLKTDGLNLRKLVPSLPAVAEQLTLDGGVMSMSVGKFTTTGKESYPESINHLFANMGGIPEMSFPPGVTINVPMDPSRLPKNLKKALTSLGIKEPAILSGTIGGIFDGEVSLSLYGKLPKLPIPSIGGKAMKVKPTDISGSLFLDLEAKKANSEMQLGIDGDLGIKIGKDKLKFGGKVYVSVSSLAQGVKVSGRIDGKWNEPLGLVDISFKDVELTGGVNADTSLDLAMKGTADFGEKLKYSMAGDISAIVGSGVPVPKKVGIMFQGSELSILTYLKIYSKLFKSALTGPLAFAIPAGETKNNLKKLAKVDLISTVESVVPLPYMIYKDPAFYLSTPGASVPGFDDLGGLGGGLRGSLLFFGHDFGSVNTYLTLKNGLRLNTIPGDLNLGFIALKNAELDIKVPMPGIGKEKAYAKLTGDMSAGCSFIEGGTDIFFSRDTADFKGSGQIGKYKTSFTSKVDLSKFPRFNVLGEFPKDIAKDIVTGFSEWGKKASKKIKAEKKKLDNIKIAAKKKLEKEKKNVKSVFDKKFTDKRNEINKKIKGLRIYVDSRVNDNKKYPARRKAWELVAKVAGKIRLSKDGVSISGIKEIRNKIEGAVNMVKKLPSKVGKKIKNTITQRINKVKKDVSLITNLAKNIKRDVNNSTPVKKARAKLDKSQKEFEKSRKKAASVVLDPVLDTIDKTINILVIDKVGFDTGLEALCKKELPMLNIIGRFKGAPFNIQNALAFPTKKTDYSGFRDILVKLIKK
ncbi:MAG: hypothetical protein KAU29_10265 [Gammaproteobacteria bacterium]|nr:hypothetical protein [Gammaproteobacteria bacterium]